MAVHVTQEALGAAVGDPHRSTQPEREQTRVHLQADVLAGAERPADAGEHEPHRVDRQVEARSDLPPVLMEPLRRDMQLDASATGIRHSERRFQPEECLILHPDLVGPLDDDVTGEVEVAGDDALVTDQIAIGMNRCMAPVDRRLGIEQWFQELPLDDDRLERPPARLGMVGGNRGDRFTHVSNDVGSEHRLVLADEAVGELARDVGGRDHGLDAVDLPGSADIDRTDPGVRVRRTQGGAPQATVGREVGGEFEAPLHLGGSVGTRRRRPDRARTCRRTDGRGVGDRHCARLRSTATRWTASMIRPYPVHRHTLPASSSRISVSVGCRTAFEQVVHRHDQARCAETALHCSRLDERRLHV